MVPNNLEKSHKSSFIARLPTHPRGGLELLGEGGKKVYVYVYKYTGAHIKSFGLCRGDIAFLLLLPGTNGERKTGLFRFDGCVARTLVARRMEIRITENRPRVAFILPARFRIVLVRHIRDFSAKPKQTCGVNKRRACELGVRSNGPRQKMVRLIYVHVQGSLS